jgi:diadenosine tetraphosphate (Ap4A) HIT family hydrolase
MSFKLNSILEKDTYPLIDLPLSKLLLKKDANFKWFILVPRRDGIREIIDLEQRDRDNLFKEICNVSEILKKSYNPYKLNIAAIGNVVEQLHVHIILRDQNDPLYPKPVWGNGLTVKEYTQEEINNMKSVLNKLLS